jgi:uncharacterized protein YfaS (alpha-2-macroglobulin family)
MAIGNLETVAVPPWWYGAFYWSRLRDTAGVLAIAAETGHAEAAAPLLERLSRQSLDPEQMNTQEKAWLLTAVHALVKPGTTRALAVDGETARTVPLPFALSPTVEQLEHGMSIRNADAEPVFRTLTVRGSPVEALPALSVGFKLRRETMSLNGKLLDDSRPRQTDRFIVVLSGSVDDSGFRRAMLLDALPAGLEIEAPVLREETYSFLGQLTELRAHEERDDRFVAAFDIGGQGHPRDVDDSKPRQLHSREFRVAYVVRAVTPGRFVRPETVVQDMYRPQVMARTAAGRMEVLPR